MLVDSGRSYGPAHPRAYGERCSKLILPSEAIGLSPRIRGKRLICDGCSRSYRLIPAHTGNACVLHLLLPAVSAHPRAYGEREPVCAGFHGLQGSPPCIRGTLFWLLFIVFSLRLTPVHTGNARRVPAGSTLKQAHPRAYGEREEVIFTTRRYIGSPPCIRGTPVLFASRGVNHRLTPVHTGNARSSSSSFSRQWAHPRAYGERFALLKTESTLLGSSPRIRGTHITTRHDA